MTNSLLTFSADDVPELSGGASGDDGLFESLLWQESRGRQNNKDGTPVTSKKGAIGIAQVMPDTAPEAARLAGLEFDDVKYRSDKDYNKAIGKAYFQKQLTDFGDTAKALAAYNAGPGAMRRALAAAEKAGQPDAWLRYLPAETQAYVPAILRKAGSSGAASSGAAPASAPADGNGSYYAPDSTQYATLPPPVPPRSMFEAAADAGLSLGAGVVAGGAMLASAAGADNPVAQGLDKTAKAIESLESPQRKAQKAARAETIQRADESGSTWEEVKAYGGALLEAPAETILNAIGTSAPTLLMSFIPGLGQANAVRLIAQGAIGAAQGAGSVKGSIFDAVERKLTDSGVDPDTARKVASGAQAYDGPNRDQILIGMGIGAIAGTTGAEASVARTAAGGAVNVERGMLARAGVGAAKESPVEGLQGGQERAASNVALQREGFDVPTMQGVIGQAVLEAGASAPMGGAAGALERGHAVPPAMQPIADKAAQPNSPLSKAALAGNTGPLAEAARAATQQQADQETAAAEQAKKDPLAAQVQQLEATIRQDGALDALRAENSPVDVKKVLADLALAKSPSAQPAQREQAITRLQYALEWAGVNPAAQVSSGIEQIVGDAPVGAAVQRTPTEPNATQLRAGADRDAQLQAKLAAATTDFEREQIRAQAETNRQVKMGAQAPATAAANQAPAPIQPGEQERLEAAALAGKNAERRAEDEPRQVVLTRALKNIEERGGVASPQEAQIVAEAGLGKPYDRIDENLGPQASMDQKLTQATGIALDKAPRSTMIQGVAEEEAAGQAAERAARQDSRLTTQEREAQARQRGVAAMQGIAAQTAGRPLPAPSVDAVVSALKVVPALRTAEQAATVRQAQTRYGANDLKILLDAAQMPAGLSVTDKIRLQQLKDGKLSAPRDAAAEPEERTTITAPRVTAEAAAGTGPAVFRKRRATLRQIADMGLNRVEMRGKDFFLTDGRREFRLEGAADAALARQAVRALIDEKTGRATGDTASNAQVDADNYLKGEPVTLYPGVTFISEHGRGTVRFDRKHSPPQWQQVMTHPYGDIAGTMGADGDKIDAFVVGDGDRIFVIDQVNADGRFDEHKVILRVRDEQSARRAYLSNYEPGWTGLAAITEMTPEQFRSWISKPALTSVGDISGATRSSDAGAAGARDAAQGADDGAGVADRSLRDARADDGSADDDAARAPRASGAADAPTADEDARRYVTAQVDGKKVRLPIVDVSTLGNDSPRRDGQSTQVTRAAAEMIQALGSAMGKEVVFFADEHNELGDGFVLPLVDSALFLNESSTINQLAVFGHEFFHLLQREEPQIHAAIRQVIMARLKKDAPANYRKDYYGLKDPSNDALNSEEIEELTSDFGGNLIADSAFWREVMDKLDAEHGAEAKGLIAKLAARLYAMIDALVAHFKDSSQPGYRATSGDSSPYVDDMQAVRAAFRDGLAKYLAARGVTKASMQAEILRAGQDVKRSKKRNIDDLSTTRDGDVLRIENLDIAYDFRGQGFGRDAVRNLIREARDDGVRRIELDSRHDAEEFWSKMGFVQVGDGDEDSIPMAMDLGDSKQSTRRNFLIASAATLANAGAQAQTTLGKAKPVPEEIANSKVSAEVEKILRGNGATNPAGAKALREALRLIATKGPQELRALAADIGPMLPETGLMLAVENADYNAHGAVEFSPALRMRLFQGQVSQGLRHSTVLHESLHVAVAARYRTLSNGVMRENDSIMGMPAPAAAKAMEQFRAVWDEFRVAAREDKAFKDPALKVSVQQAVGSPDEFFVRALTDPQLQAAMAKVEYQGKTLLERFKDWVKQSLFLWGKPTGTAPSWLDAALTASTDLMQAAAKDPADGKRMAAVDRVSAKRSAARDVTETPEFKKWFGASKVVDAQGKPLVVYHGTDRDFASHINSGSKLARTAGGQFLGDRSIFFFTSDASVASGFAGNKDGANVRPTYLSIANPLVIDGRGKNWARYEYQVKQAFDSGKYDGAIVQNVDDNVALGDSLSDVYVAFKPEQVKSATGNNGQFDGASADITRSAAREKFEDDDRLGSGASEERGSDEGSRDAVLDRTPAYGTPRAGAVSVLGRHYSTGKRSFLSGAAFGRGLKGAERERLADAGDRRLRDRISFYIDTGKGIRPEAGVGAYAHEVQLNNIYDPRTKLIPPQKSPNAFESAVIDAGFDGYMIPDHTTSMGAAVLLGPKHQQVPVRFVGTPAAAAAPEQKPAFEVEKKFDSKPVDGVAGIEQLDLSKIPGAKIKYGYLTIPMESREAANDEMARVGASIRFSAKRDVTETPEFKTWFGDSKVVDEKGEPLVVLHGTRKDFSAFDQGRFGDTDEGTTGAGIYATPDKDFANAYTVDDMTKEGEGGNVMPLYMSIQNPIGFDEATSMREEIIDEMVARGADRYKAEQKSGKALTMRLMRMGYDGVEPGFDGAWIAFDPSQVKSAIGNSGAFSRNTDDITRSARRTPVKPEVAAAAGPAMRFLTDTERAKLRVDTATKLADLFAQMPSPNEMAAVAWAGKAKRGWYRESAQALMQVFGPDAPRFAGLLAAMSPQTSVEINLRNALNTWKNWVRAGRPLEKQAIFEIMGKSVEGNGTTDSVLPAWVPNSVRALTSEDPEAVVLSGPKVNSFMLNLRGVTEEVTNDAWMANYAAVDQRIFSGSLNVAGTDPGKGPGYMAMSARVRQAAKKLSDLTGEDWTPAEIQETVWSWAKTLYELQDKNTTARQLLDNEAVTDDLIASTPDFRTQLHEERNEETLREAGYGPQIDSLRERGVDARPGEQGPEAGGKAAPFDRDAEGKLLRKAGRRLEELKAARAAAEAQTRELAAGDVKASRARLPAGVEEGLEGLPRQVEVPGHGTIVAGRLTAAADVARKYMAAAGMPYTPPTKYVKVDAARATRIAQAYADMKHAPRDADVRAAYAALVNETTEQYRAVMASGLKVEFIDLANGDPYAASPRLMTEDVRENNHMWVFSTRDGFGSSEMDVSDNPLLAETEFEISGQKALVNDLFRVVHDYFGHVKEGVGFRADGEENAWRAHSAMFTPLARKALTTETRAQNSWVNYGPHGEKNRKASGADTVFADQKTGLLPDWVSEDGASDATAPTIEERIAAVRDLIACLGK